MNSKKIHLTGILMILLIFLANSFVFAGWGRGQNGIGRNSGGTSSSTMASLFPKEPLSEVETSALLKMVEEEKLARDVYLYLYEIYKSPVFSNISTSEQRHMDAVAGLLSKYGLSNPVANLGQGEFATEEMQDLYDSLISKGATDITQAYIVGATIEDLDIKDLEDLLAQVDNQDIKFVFQNLMKGSRNHMRAFASSLKSLGVTYEAQYISPEELESIITSQWERGPVDENGNALLKGAGRRGGGRNANCCITLN